MVNEAIFEGGLTRAQARRQTPFELLETIEAARYRAFRIADAIAYGAYLVMQTNLGRRTPKFEKILGRKSAQKFKEACYGLSKKEEAQLAAEFKKLREKVEAKHGR